MFFPFIQAKGTSYEIGHQLGIKLKQQITHNLEVYKELFFQFAGLEWKDVQKLAKQYIPWIERYDKDLIDEIQGMSEGAHVDFLDILALNARTEIMMSSDGCTSIAAARHATSHAQTLIGQNWDWNVKIKPGMAIVELDQQDKPNILMVTEAGIIGKIGMNSSGIGVCLNMLNTTESIAGVPVHIVLRGILNSHSLSQAIGQIGRLRRGNAANFLVASREGEILNVESTPQDYDVIGSESGVIAHTNHFYGPRQVNVNDLGRISFPDTHLRLEVANRLLKQSIGTINESTIEDVFTNHIGYPDSICRHGSFQKPELGREKQSDTVFSIMMNLTEGKMKVAAGQPCTYPYQDFSIPLVEKRTFNEFTEKK